MPIPFSFRLSALTISALVLPLLVAFAAEGSPLHVMIDPGHGGTDSGAVGDKIKEAEIALKVSLLLKSKLNADPEFQVTMTRSTDKNVSLTERVRLAEKAKADVFLSIHLNANRDSRAKGVELYFQNHLPPDEETLFLAASENQVVKPTASAGDLDASDAPTKKNDVTAIVEDLQRHHRMLSSHSLSVELLKAWNLTPQQARQSMAIRQAPFYVISKANIPSVLVELGFVTNAHEAEKLGSPSYQAEIAQKIYQGLLLYKQNWKEGGNKVAPLSLTEKELKTLD